MLLLRPILSVFTLIAVKIVSFKTKKKHDNYTEYVIVIEENCTWVIKNTAKTIEENDFAKMCLKSLKCSVIIMKDGRNLVFFSNVNKCDSCWMRVCCIDIRGGGALFVFFYLSFLSLTREKIEPKGLKQGSNWRFWHLKCFTSFYTHSLTPYGRH